MIDHDPSHEDILWHLGEWEHLPFHVLVGYVDNESEEADREIVEGHLAICAECQADIDNLHALRSQMFG